jgi:sarcosine oxidase
VHALPKVTSVTTRCDVVVVGLGAMGSATTLHLTRAGAQVIGIDGASPPNADGSSHGETRITRLAVGEGPAYVPLVGRSHELWRQFEEEQNETLFVQCGGLILGRLHSSGQHGVENFVAATIEVARSNGIVHELLTSEEIRRRFGVFDVTDEVGYYEATAGYLRAPACVRAQLALARRAGATLRLHERALGWTCSSTGVEVTTESGRISAGAMVLAAGAWLPELAPELAPLLSVQRQVQYWFDMESHVLDFEALPIFIWMHGTEAGQYLYGFPAVDGPHGGVKIATEVFGTPTTPRHVVREVDGDEIAEMYDGHVSSRFAGLSSRCLRTAVCLYTVTPDFGFLVDRHPAHANVIVASPCSGHGFKHSAAIGESVAQLVLDGASTIDLSAFSFARFDAS